MIKIKIVYKAVKQKPEIREIELDKDYLHHVDDPHLGEAIIASIHQAENNREEIGGSIHHHVELYKKKVVEMRAYFVLWLKEHFS